MVKRLLLFENQKCKLCPIIFSVLGKKPAICYTGKIDMENDMGFIQNVLSRRIHKGQNSTTLFNKAIEEGNGTLLRSVVSQISDDQLLQKAFVESAEKGYLDNIKILAKHTNPKGGFANWATVKAAGKGHTQCVEFLLTVSDINWQAQRALVVASANGHLECVKMLLEVVDPSTNNSEALNAAVFNRQENCINILYPLSPLKDLQTISQECSHHHYNDILKNVRSHMEAEEFKQRARQRSVLLQSASTAESMPTPPRKI